ncbi:MAG: 2-phospho-L-lactate guanylyltransferase [Nocardioides sp.]
MKHPRFVVLVPVKDPDIGKSRLRIPAHLRPGLASAFALDTVHAAREAGAVAEVVVVTGDPGFAGVVAELGFACLDDVDGGLNDSLVAAAAAVRERHADARPVALCADLPSLRPADLTAALRALPEDESGYVADADGTGTTLYAAPYDAFEPRFGHRSAAAHASDGAHAVPGALPTLRRDVDDETSLAVALRLGVGRFTQDVVSVLGAGA